MKITLIHPPLDDPTIPYHSTSYLAGNLQKNGFSDVATRDINIEYVNWCFRKNIFLDFYEEAERRLRCLSSKSHLTFQEQEEYFGLWSCYQPSFEQLDLAVSGMRDLEKFLDWEMYLKNIQTIEQYFSFLGALSYPGEINNCKLTTNHKFSPYNHRDLFNQRLLDRICFPFTRYLQEVLAQDEGLRASDLIGVSIIYDHQIFHALHLIRYLRSLWPEKTLILGGTSISAFYKNLKNPALLERFLSICDGIVVGEGETALCQIADSGGHLCDREIWNLIHVDPTTSEIQLPATIHFENVPTLGAPRYDYDWDLYLSPERMINYSPTRGCYWNRCTFCDYGLNVDKPTSPWRETPIDKVLCELNEIQRRQNVKYVYFAVDVMAPGYIERLADALIEAKLGIRWAAELRMEKIFSRKRCGILAQSGAVCISFGMESGNQRILDLIDKGTKVTYMKETMKNFSESGVAVQLMAFSHFPSETKSDFQDSIRFIQENEGHWSTLNMDRFVLTGKAIVARNPGKFGINLIDIHNIDTEVYVAYSLDQEVHKGSFQENEEHKYQNQLEGFPKTLIRPWAGSTDTLHSMIYYDTFGRHFFKENRSDGETKGPSEIKKAALGAVKQTPFPLRGILRNRDRFREFARQLKQTPAEPTYEDFLKWADSQENLSSEAVSTFWIEFRQKMNSLSKHFFHISSHGNEVL